MVDGYAGFQGASDGASPFNSMQFMVKQLINKIVTNGLVQVMAVTNAGGVSPVGFVDVQPMVNQVDGAGVPVPHGTIFNLPYFRLQGGANAIIIDPAVGDIGAAVFCSHDISSVKANRAVSNPGSRRRFRYADGLYFGGHLNGVPTQYIQFGPGGITMSSPTALTLTAGGHTVSISSAGIILDGVNWQHGHPYFAGTTPAETGHPESP